MPNKPPPGFVDPAAGLLELALLPNPVELPQLELPKFILYGNFDGLW